MKMQHTALVRNSVRLRGGVCFAALGVVLAIHVMSAGSAFADDAPEPSSPHESANPGETATPDEIAFFESKIRPLLVTHCYECHGGGSSGEPQAGIRVDFREGLLRGGDSGPAIVPGKPEESLLVEAVRYESFEMPPKGKLAATEIEAIARWVEMGAPWPDEAKPGADEHPDSFDLPSRKKSHWVWRPITDPDPPKVERKGWVRNEIDRFVLAKLEAAGMEPAPPVDRRGLVRRLYFDLIGLPPTPTELAEAMRGDRDEAIGAVVDRLLDSPHFGERWGRHWLDLVRYAESRGHEFDDDAGNAFQYRDYVIRAFNADVPYDQLVREHIAGDLLERPRQNPDGGFNESILGTGFWYLGEWVHSPVDIRKDESERFDNMIDVFSKTFLGVTVACARCHDHKFDAISTADYYALTGFLQSSDYRQVRFDSLDHNRKIAAALDSLDREYETRLRPVIASALLVSGGPVDDSGNSDGPNVRPEESPKTPVSTGRDRSGKPDTRGSVLVDFGTLPPERYRQNGVIFGSRPRRPGEMTLVAPAGGTVSEEGGNAIGDDRLTVSIATRGSAVNDPFWDGLVSHGGPKTNVRGKLESLPRSGRTLRSPTFRVTKGQVWCELRGTGHIVACVDSHRLVAGPLHGETIVRVEPDESDRFRRIKLNLTRYQGHRLHLEFTPDEGKRLEVFRIVEGSSADEGPSGNTVAPIAADRSRRREAIQAWERGVLSEHPDATALAKLVADAIGESGRWRDARLEDGSTVGEAIGVWYARRQRLRDERKLESPLAMAMLDGSGEEGQLLIRGNASNPGAEVPRSFLTAIDGERPLEITRGSGRLQLAQRVNDSDNPLTRRVIVNRIWHHLMGRGIVPTTDDFGVLGARPTHPELLDHLAIRFDEDGQSIKQAIRDVVMSSTYQMSGRADPDAAMQDPKNELWHHVPPRRLEGEAIRDSLLAVSGKLDRQLYGPSVPVHLTPFMDGRGRPPKSGPIDGNGRRSIYTAVRRNFLSPFMLAFDMPVPFSTMGRRNVSNVPAQSLIMMNDPFVIDCAKGLGSRAVNHVPGEITGRIEWLYQTTFGRPPTIRELDAAERFVRAEAADRGGDVHDDAVWGELAHALVNTKEYLFLR